MKRKILIAVVTAIAVILVVTKLISNAKMVEERVYVPDKNASTLVKVTSVSYKPIDLTYSFSGVLQPQKEVDLIPQSQGRVTEVYFKEGDFVVKGKVLAEIDDSQLQAQFISAKASLDFAKASYDRYQNASQSEGITQMQLDNALLQLRNAESQVKQIENMIAKCKIVAPFSGTITTKSIEKGSTVSGFRVASLSDLSVLKLEVAVPESQILHLKIHDQVEVNVPYGDNGIISGSIEYVSDKGDASHMYTIHVMIPNEQKKIKAGMFGEVTIRKTAQKKSVTIPRTALVGSTEKPQVYVLENSRSILRDIELGISNATEMEVVKGLEQKDTVIISGLINLSDGALARAIKN